MKMFALSLCLISVGAVLSGCGAAATDDGSASTTSAFGERKIVPVRTDRATAADGEIDAEVTLIRAGKRWVQSGPIRGVEPYYLRGDEGTTLLLQDSEYVACKGGPGGGSGGGPNGGPSGGVVTGKALVDYVSKGQCSLL